MQTPPDPYSELEKTHDWTGLIAALSHQLEHEKEDSVRAQLHLRLARVLFHRRLQPRLALEHYREAVALQPSLLEAYAEAREIYWQLGETPMVRRLLEAEIRARRQERAQAALWIELGDLLADSGQEELARKAFSRALETAADEEGTECSQRLQDLDASNQRRSYIDQLRLRAEQQVPPPERAQLLARAARIATRCQLQEAASIWRAAYAADPLRHDTAMAFERAHLEVAGPDEVLNLQRRLLDDEKDPQRHARLALRFGSRWGHCYDNHRLAADFLEETLRCEPDNEPAFELFLEICGNELGDWSRVVSLAESLASSARGTTAAHYWAIAAQLCEHRLRDSQRAQGYYEKLAETAADDEALCSPQESSLQAAGLEQGAPMTAQRPEVSEVDVEENVSNEPSAPPSGEVAGADMSMDDMESSPSEAPDESGHREGSLSEAPETSRALTSAPPPSANSSSEPPEDDDDGESMPPEASLQEEDAELVQGLREKLAQQEEQNRAHEVVKTLVALGDAVADPTEKLELYRRAGELYATRFMNPAEAVRVNEKILAVDRSDQEAHDYLLQMYEKRRDWNKLIRLRKGDAARIEDPELRVAAMKEIAQLATERIKKPAVCIGLWEAVRQGDPDDPEALDALAKLYERGREFEKLADILERLAATAGGSDQVQILTKLGQIVGDRLKDDNRAIGVFRNLVALDPDNRRAQEQLKKRYVALGRWDDLDDFYAVSGKWDEFIRVLESNEARAETEEQRIRMLAKIADLWETQRQRPERAARAYEKILSLQSDNTLAAERLIPIYTQANNARGLANVLEVRLGAVEDVVERLELLRQLAELYESRLREPEKAFERYLEALQLVPTDEQAQSDAERLAGSCDGWPRLVTAYENAIGVCQEDGDFDTVATLRVRLGRVHIEQLQDLDAALAEYRAVCDAQPDNVDALRALESLYSEAGRFQELLDVYLRRAELCAGTDESIEISRQIAELQEQKLNDPAAAIASYQDVLTLQPLDAGALEALDRLYQQTEEWEQYVLVLERRLELDVDERQLVDLKFRLAQAREAHIRDAELALDTYREVLTLEPAHEGARAALERMLDDPLLAPSAAQVLETIYEVLGQWEPLLRASQILAESADEPQLQVELFSKVANIAETRLESPSRAFAAFSKALLIEPSNETTVAELERLADSADAWAELGSLYHQVAEQLGPSELSRAFLLRAAANEERLGDVSAAAENYERLLETDPADAEVLQALHELYSRAERWEDLLGVFRRRIDLAAGGEGTISLYSQLAELHDQRLGRPDEAIATYREALALDPTSDVVLSRLDDLYGRTERFVELADNLSTRLELAESEEKQRQLMLRLAELSRTRLDDAQRSIDLYRELLERDPLDEEARQCLEQMSEGPHELVVSEILEPLYQQQGEYEKLVQVYETQARCTDDPAHRVELLHKIASLHEDVASDLTSAFRTYVRALEIDPLDPTTVQGLERISRGQNNFDQLARAYENLASSQPEGSELTPQLYASAARVVELEMFDVERAVSLYRQVLEVAPHDLAAMEALQRLFLSAERHAELSRVLQDKADVLEELSERKAALYEAATLEQDLLGRPEEAVRVYERVLELDPEDERALDRLIALFLELAKWESLLEMQQRKVELLYEPDEKKAIYYQMGAVYERELADVPRAIDTYQRVLELEPDDLTALGRLDVLYQASENWGELLTILGQEAELTSDPAEAISYQFRVAELYEKRLGDVERAVELYRDVLNVQTDHGPTLAALEGIKDGGGEHALTAALTLEPVYDAMAEWERLVGALSVQARFSEDAFTRVELLHRIAQLHEERIGDQAGAFDWYARAVKEDCSNEESLGAVERLAAATDRWPAVAELYSAELSRLQDDPERFVELGLRVAQVYEVQLVEVEAAVDGYRAVLEVDSINQGAIRALGRLFTKAERWQELADILQKEAAVGTTPDEILDSKYRLGQVYQNHLGDYAAAVRAYDEVLSSAPEHEASRVALEDLFAEGHERSAIGDILEPLYESTGEWHKLVQVHEAQLTELTDPEDRLGMYHRIAEDYEERLGEVTHAFGVLARALHEQPTSERVHEELERLSAGFDGGWEELANTYADVMSVEDAPVQVQAYVGLRLARVFEEELADVEKAEESYRYVLTVSPEQGQALENLDRIYLAMEQWEDLAGVLEQRARAADDDLRKVELYSRLGQVYESSLDRPEDALRAYRLIFDELAPDDADTTAALVRIYEKTEAYESLQEVYERQLANALGDVDQADIRAKLARLLSEHLGRDEEAIDAWKRVLDLRGEDTEALDALATIYERRQEWAELGDILERLYDVALEDSERVNALTRRARLFTVALGKHEEALETWQRVLDIDFSNLVALRAIADLRRARQEHPELVDALHQCVDRAGEAFEPDELRELYREMATLYAQQLDQPEDAADSWRKLLQVDAKDQQALVELEAHYRSTESWEDVVDIKKQRAAATEEPSEKIEQLLEAAAVWRDQVREYDQAVEVLGLILQADPTHEFAFQELEKLHMAAGRWEPLVEVYLGRLDATEDTAVRADLLRRIAKVFEEHLDDAGQAFDALVTAFSEDFFDDETVEYLERIAQLTQRWGELITMTNDWLQEQTEDKQKIQLCLRLGKWYGENLGRPDYAQPYYKQITQLDPNNAQVLRQMAHIYRQSAQWQKMGDALTRALQVAVVNDDRKMIMVDLGLLLERHMDKRDEGVSYFRRALEIDPYHLPALEALERIHAESREYTELAEVLERKSQALRKPDETAQAQLQLGELYEKQLSNYDKAGAVYRSVVEYDPASMPALAGLQRVYEHKSDWTELVVVLEKQLDIVETERARLDLLLKLAQIQEQQFLKADIAAERLEQVLDIDPTELSAYEALERCYRRLKKWTELVSTCERHIGEVTTSAQKIALFHEMARVYADELQDLDRAIDAHQNIVDLDDTNLTALEALARLHEKQGDTARSIEVMTRVADLTADGKQRVDMYYRIGRALEEQLFDRGQARERFEMALDLDPSHLPTLGALRAIAKDEGDWDAVCRYLDQEQQHTESARARARLLVELGQVYSETLGEEAEAIAAYERAVSADDDCEEAALPLVRHYVASERWSDATPLAEMLARKSKGKEKAEQHFLYQLLGKVHQAQGNYSEALAAYHSAHQCDVTDAETVMGLAQVTFALADWPSALVNYQKVLSGLSESDVEARTEVYYRIGRIKQEQGQGKQAINNFEKALALDAEYRPALEALVQVYEAEQQWQLVASLLQRILEQVVDDEERLKLLMRIADVWSTKEKEPSKAVEVLEEAREIRPQDHVILHRLLECYQASGDWNMMIQTLSAIAELEEQPSRKARYSYTMAQLYRDKIQDLDRSVELFNEALDLDSSLLEAFERINKILTQERNWKQLERQYRKMLHRVAGKGKPDLEFNLWHQLGLVYRDRIASVQPAIEAFKMASGLRPDNTQERVILSELYEVAGEVDKAIQEQRVLLEAQPLTVAPYRALYRLYTAKQDRDAAWCVASALVFMQQARPDERAFYERHKAVGMPQVTGRLTNDAWARHLMHREENVYISKMFEMITPAALQAKIAMLKAKRQLPELDKRLLQDPQSSTVTFAKTFFWAAKVLGVHAPELYVRSDIPGSVVAVPMIPPASLAGQTVLTGFSPQELTFICGKHLASYRGEHYIRTLFPTQGELTIMLFAGVMVAASNTPMPPDMAQQIRVTAQELGRYIQPVQLEGLRAVVKRFIAEGAKANMKRWNQAVEMTSARAGLLLCGDLEICKKVLSSEQVRPGEPSAADKMKELMAFSVSEGYMALRKLLGVAVA